MSYSIIWKPKPLKFLNKLQKDIALRILDKIDSVNDNPFRYLEHYEGEDCYKLRIGHYRALIDVNLKERILIIEFLDKRERIYNR